MTMQEIYQSRKSALSQRIKESKSLYETGSVISEAFETMQYQYLSAVTHKVLSDKLTGLVAVAKAGFPLIESVNKTKLWETYKDGEEQPKKKSPLPGLIFMLLGLCAIWLCVGYYMFINNISFQEAKSWLLFIAVGCGLLIISGFLLFHRKKERVKTVVEVGVDGDDLVKRLGLVIQEIDRLMEQEAEELKIKSAFKDTSIQGEELDLFAFLLEAKYSGQPDFAMEQLDEVEHYLATQDVILVPYSKGNEKYFEFLEGESNKTLRPALVQKGEVLRKGLATMAPEVVQQ
ncbi:MAG: hypothetical protein RR253_05590 [Oscillospiraceae bacterium]